MKKLIAISILTLTVLSFGVNNDKRTDAITKIVTYNVASDTIVEKRGEVRAIKADVGGIVKIWQIHNRDTVMSVEELPDLIWIPIGNIIKISPLWNGADSTTCQVRDTSGALVRGIKVGY